jgi:hypothetical protein
MQEYEFYEGHRGPNQYATGLLRFKLLPNRYATLELSVAMVDDGGTENGGDDTLLQNITLRIRSVNLEPYALFQKTLPVPVGLCFECATVT